MPRRNRRNRGNRSTHKEDLATESPPSQPDPRLSQYPSFKFDESVPETAAVKRLMRDLSELQREELDTVSACPLEDNILEWHVNLTDPNGAYQGIFVHCVMEFPPTYPRQPPKVRVLTSIPHPNVMGSHICLSMLTSYGARRMDQFEGWSSAYSVTSILCQLQSFFFAENIRQESGHYAGAHNDGLSIRFAKETARSFVCETCGHSHDNPFPRVSCFDRRTIAQTLPSTNNESSFDKWADLPQDCSFVVMQFLDSVSLYCASWTMREWWNVFEKYSLDARQSVRCFHTKLSHHDAVLGFGFRKLGSGMFTSRMDYLSEYAWSDGVREDVWGSRLDAFIPLILNRSHGQRALDSLKTALVRIHRNPVFALAKLMNDIVVVLAKNVAKAFDSKVDLQYECGMCGEEARSHWTTCHKCGFTSDSPISVVKTEKLMEMNMSEKALLGYSSLHHVLLYLVENDEKCKKTVERVVQDLVEGRVTKGETRDLGQALIFVSAVDGVSWKDISTRFTMEGWIRKVRWFTNENVEWNSPNARNYQDIFTKCSVSLCVVMFQVRFLSMVVRASRAACLAEYNRRLGRPSRGSVVDLSRFCRVMSYVMSQGTFADRYRYYWKSIGFRVVSGSDFISLLREAVKTSSKRQYHRHDNRVWYEWNTPRGFRALDCFVHRTQIDNQNDAFVDVDVDVLRQDTYAHEYHHPDEFVAYAQVASPQQQQFVQSYVPVSYGVPVSYPTGHIVPAQMAYPPHPGYAVVPPGSSASYVAYGYIQPAPGYFYHNGPQWRGYQ